MNTPHQYSTLVALATLLVACGAGSKPDVCSMQSPPANSKVKPTHAGNLLTYPPALEAGYSGCRVIWMENGYRLATVRLEHGRVRSVEVREPDGRAMGCEFDSGGALTAGEASTCQPSESWLN
jgi:hypothetical protein